MIRPLLSVLSPAGERARLSVLIFHRVTPETDPLFPGEVDAARFDDICGWLRGWFTVLPLAQALASLQQGTLPARALAITFDDGYADNHDVALPILRRHGLTATFFIATGFLDGGRMWNDTLIESVRLTTRSSLDLDAAGLQGLRRVEVVSVEQKRAALASMIAVAKYLAPAERARAVLGVANQAGVEPPRDLMMSSQQVIALHRAGMTIGAHTVTHPILAKLDRAAAREEIDAGRRALEALTQSRVGLFAYPNGRPGEDYDARAVEIVRELGFDGAVSTAWGASTRWVDRYQVPRFTPWDRSRWRYGLRLAANLRRPA
jgi:peptidoglycan/xylan/chitin deacetylase (PgdA/CDA1 family)